MDMKALCKPKNATSNQQRWLIVYLLGVLACPYGSFPGEEKKNDGETSLLGLQVDLEPASISLPSLLSLLS